MPVKFSLRISITLAIRVSHLIFDLRSDHGLTEERNALRASVSERHCVRYRLTARLDRANT